MDQFPGTLSPTQRGARPATPARWLVLPGGWSQHRQHAPSCSGVASKSPPAQWPAWSCHSAVGARARRTRRPRESLPSAALVLEPGGPNASVSARRRHPRDRLVSSRPTPSTLPILVSRHQPNGVSDNRRSIHLACLKLSPYSGASLLIRFAC